eukprot:15438146-Alexandrium_andersonii.AAC.1
MIVVGLGVVMGGADAAFDWFPGFFRGVAGPNPGPRGLKAENVLNNCMYASAQRPSWYTDVPWRSVPRSLPTYS